MKNILEKSAKGSSAFIILILTIYFGIEYKGNIALVILLSFISSFSVLYIWYSSELLKKKEILEKENSDLKNQLEKLEVKINKLKDNNEGLIDERTNYQRKLDQKDNKIYFLEKRAEELQVRVLLYERNE